jgi:hypothetical protein
VAVRLRLGAKALPGRPPRAYADGIMDTSDRIAQLVDNLVASFYETGLPTEDLAPAMLAKAVTLLIAEVGADETARLLAELAADIVAQREPPRLA